MSERGRPPGFRMTEEHRTKIANSQILNRLIRAAEGEIDISATQASIGLGLLRKVMPDLASTALTGGDDDDNPISHTVRFERVIVDPPPRPDDGSSSE